MIQNLMKGSQKINTRLEKEVGDREDKVEQKISVVPIANNDDEIMSTATEIAEELKKEYQETFEKMKEKIKASLKEKMLKKGPESRNSLAETRDSHKSRQESQSRPSIGTRELGSLKDLDIEIENKSRKEEKEKFLSSRSETKYQPTDSQKKETRIKPAGKDNIETEISERQEKSKRENLQEKSGEVQNETKSVENEALKLFEVFKNYLEERLTSVSVNQQVRNLLLLI